jgi:hypothetical protein
MILTSKQILSLFINLTLTFLSHTLSPLMMICRKEKKQGGGGGGKGKWSDLDDGSMEKE